MAFQARVTAALLGLLAAPPGLLAQGLKERATLKGHPERATCVAFSPDGKTLASAGKGFDGRKVWADLRLWDVATGRERLALRCHTNEIGGMAFSPDGRVLATASSDYTLEVWDLIEGEGQLALKERTTFRPPSLLGRCCMAFSPDGKRLAAAGGQEVKLWDLATGREIASHKLRVNVWSSVALSPDLRTLAAPNYEDVDLWDLATGEERAPLLDHRGAVWRVAFTGDGRALVVGSQRTEEGGRFIGEVKLWDLATGKERMTLNDRPGFLRDLALSSDGGLLVLQKEQQPAWAGELKLLALPSGRVLGTVSFKGGRDLPFSLAFAANGKVLAAGYLDGTVRLWDVIPPQSSNGPEGRGGASGK
jgi:WD40 repeat protein